MAKKKTINFEKSLASLEALVETLESGDVNLEEALSLFEKGVQLTRDCQTALNEAEQKVALLLEESGALQAHDFYDEDLEEEEEQDD